MDKRERTPEEKQLAMMRLQTVLLVCILLFLIIAGVALLGQFSQLTAAVAEVDLQQINELAAGLSDLADSLNEMDAAALNETVASLQKAADNLSAVDMQSLNEAVSALSGAANTLKKLDISGLNDLVASLEVAANKLESTTSAIAASRRLSALSIPFAGR